MQVSESAREVIQSFIYELVKCENNLFAELKYLMNLKNTIGEKLFSLGITESRVMKARVKLEIIDKQIEPLSNEHQKVTDQLRRFGMVVNHN